MADLAAVAVGNQHQAAQAEMGEVALLHLAAAVWVAQAVQTESLAATELDGKVAAVVAEQLQALAPLVETVANRLAAVAAAEAA